MNIQAFQYSNAQYGHFAPYVSNDTMHYHFDKHYMGYINKYNQLIQDTQFADKSLEVNLEQISAEMRNGNMQHAAIFNNGAQVWNHYFYWASMREVNQENNPAQSAPHDIQHLMDACQGCGHHNDFRTDFINSGIAHFASGWLWLVLIQDKGHQVLDLICTKNADSPRFYTQDAYSIRHNVHISKCNPIIVCDLWEHAYYLDHQNKRAEYLEVFFDHLINWDVAKRNINNVGIMTQSSDKLPTIKLVGVSNTITLGNDDAVKTIEHTIKQYTESNIRKNISNIVGKDTIYSVYTAYHANGYTYFVGVEVESFDGVDLSKFKTLEIPAQRYARFDVGPGEVGNNCSHAWKTIWGMTPQELNGQRKWIADFEVYKGVVDTNNAKFEVYVGIV